MYCVIKNQLQKIVNPAVHNKHLLKLQFGMDGLSLYKSSSKEFWPILGKIYTKESLYKPFVIAVYCGQGKPACATLFLSKFVDELNTLLVNGVKIKGQHFNVVIMCFICDRPARALVKYIKGHTGFYACERCTVKDYTYKNRTIFPLGNEKRTDSFRNQINKEHHLGISPLTKLNPPIDMIGLFVLDSMHLCFLGVMKKFLTDYWMKSGSSHKLKREQILRISQRLVNLTNQIPDEFQRTTRSLGNINK